MESESLSLPQDSPESVRRVHLTHERSIQAIGALYILGCVLLVFSGRSAMTSPSSSLVPGEFLILFGCLQGWVGYHLRKINPKVKIAATIIACVGLLAFPIGTIINSYVLYLIHSAKGKVVFSSRYREVIAATPETKPKTSIIAWVCLVVFLLLITRLVLANFGLW